ncbi:MAG TPA: PD-(D/E)XK nuclease family protein [Gammaproteobacteria bacterium]|nr:PD-(D/E)XK nuclease family protein [Gammaproteobacteria bacterium]
MSFKRVANQDEVLAALEAGATVVTSGERLARALRLAHGEARHAAGAKAWERPEVLSYNAFIDRLYDKAADGALGDSARALPKRVSPAACESHWEAAIRRSPQGAALLQPSATAREAARAWMLLQAFRLPLECLMAGDEDAQAFTAWAEAFRDSSRAQGWLEDARLVDWLATRLRERALPAPRRVLFAGFDEFTPQQREFMESLKTVGAVVGVLDIDTIDTPRTRRRVEDDARAEERAAAAWARTLLEQDPAASIGIVARDLDACRGSLARALDDALCPGAAAGRDVARPYDLSLGLPLDSFPAVEGALAVLDLLRRRTPFPTVSMLLRSPFLSGADAERDARARLELKLRGRVSEVIGLKALSAFATTQGGMPLLLGALQVLIEKGAALPARQAPSAWARDFADALTRAGWPGERALDSDEYQAVTALQDLIGSLVHLDAALGPVSLGEALTRLRRLAAEHIFQPAGGDAPVQVLGLLETSGLCFDHLWVLGMSDAAWPASPRPAAFIPARLQREYDLPHASAAMELKFAQRLTERLLSSAADVVVSSPGSEADEELRPSPLVAQLPLAGESVAPLQDYRMQLQLRHGEAAENYMDAHAPALRSGEQIRGGAYLLAAQSACPFKAFGTFRLGAERLEEPALGPDALERGSLMHAVLHAVWAELEDHAGLMGRDTATRRELVSRCAAAAVTERAAALPEVYTPQVAELERERLTRRVTGWLEIEARRPPFRVLESEREHRFKIGPLTLLTRIDRIDELADGGRLLLDYKTVQVRLQSGLEERPDDPQLPLYAVGERQGLAAVSYACLKPGETGFVGLAARAGMPEGIGVYAEKRTRPAEAPDWDALLAYWGKTLTRLAEGYAGGAARVDPKTALTCERCHLSTLCRIHELRGVELEEADGEAGDDE